MKYIKYGKHIPDPFEDLSAEDLMQMLQDFLLDSGFYSQYYGVREMDPEWSSCGMLCWKHWNKRA